MPWTINFFSSHFLCPYMYNMNQWRDSVCCCLVAKSCPTLCDPMDYSQPDSSVHGDSPGKNTVGCHAFLQRIFPTQGLNPLLSHYRWNTWVLNHLSHQGSPWILKWVTYLFSRGSFWPRDQTGISGIAGRFFTNWATREARIFTWTHVYTHT